MNFKRAWDIFQKYKGDRFFEEAFGSEIYKPIRDLKSPRTIIDLGALHGEFSLYIYDRAERIYAVEPHPKAYPQLVENCKGLDKISTHQLIISDADGYKFIRGGDDGGASVSESGGENSTLVRSRTLATFMKENGIERVDALKIDIEGSEKNVLGSPDFAEIAPRIDFIIGEHSAGLKELLEPLGFKFTDGFMAERIK